MIDFSPLYATRLDPSNASMRLTFTAGDCEAFTAGCEAFTAGCEAFNSRL
jgi:hypothetical protein